MKSNPIAGRPSPCSSPRTVASKVHYRGCDLAPVRDEGWDDDVSASYNSKNTVFHCQQRAIWIGIPRRNDWMSATITERIDTRHADSSAISFTARYTENGKMGGE
jgi:hypothetical protein